MIRAWNLDLRRTLLITLWALCAINLACPALAADPPARRPVRIYLAGPLGFSEAGRLFMNSKLIPKLQGLGYEVINPWGLTPQDKIAAVTRLPDGQRQTEAWRALDPEIARNNEAGIDRADAVVAVLDGTDVDSGTAAEIGYAYGRGKPILGYRGDFRLSADNPGSKVNLQVEYFVEQHGGEIIKSLDDLPRALSAFDKIARLKARLPPSPRADAVAGTKSGQDQPEAIKDIVRFFEAAFTVVLALALSEAFQQFVADYSSGDDPENATGGRTGVSREAASGRTAVGTPADGIRWPRLWALGILLLLLLPFFQGMSRYFFLTYSSERAFPSHYALSLITDGIFFTLEAGLFFVMSRALALDHWRRFFMSVLLLLTADSIWGMIALFWHAAPVIPWLLLNWASVGLLGPVLWINWDERRLPRWLTQVILVAAFVRTFLDYYLMWNLYFPNT